MLVFEKQNIKNRFVELKKEKGGMSHELHSIASHKLNIFSNSLGQIFYQVFDSL